MSAKLQFRPQTAEQVPLAQTALAPTADILLSRIREIQGSARQICTDAADIEDARFLAESIIDACRCLLTIGYAVGSEHGRADHAPAADTGSARQSPSSGHPDADKKAAALERLAALSPRELEIFTQLAEGRSAAEIAVKLSRSSKTINNHRTRILQKLGLRNATQLVRLAVGADLVSI